MVSASVSGWKIVCKKCPCNSRGKGRLVIGLKYVSAKIWGSPWPHCPLFPTALLYCTKIHPFCWAINFGNNILNNPPYEKCYNKRALVLSPLISFKSLVNKGGAAGLSYDYADASTPHSLWVVRHFMKAGISPSDPTS